LVGERRRSLVETTKGKSIFSQIGQVEKGQYPRSIRTPRKSHISPALEDKKVKEACCLETLGRKPNPVSENNAGKKRGRIWAGFLGFGVG